MDAGKRFRLYANILGIEDTAGSSVAVTIPKGKTIRVITGPRPDDHRLVDVQWGKRTLAIFHGDLTRVGHLVRSRERYVNGSKQSERKKQ